MDKEQPAIEQGKDEIPRWALKKPLFIWPFISLVIAAPFAISVDGGVGMLFAIILAPFELALSYFHGLTGVFFAKINYEEIKKGHSWVAYACLFVFSAVMVVLFLLLSFLIRGPHPRACFDTCIDMSPAELLIGPIIIAVVFFFASCIGASRYIHWVNKGAPAPAHIPPLNRGDPFLLADDEETSADEEAAEPAESAETDESVTPEAPEA